MSNTSTTTEPVDEPTVPTLPPACEDFLSWQRDDRNRSANTLTRYRAILRGFARYADPTDATMEQAEAWWTSRYGKSAATRANELACMRSFYSWATRWDLRPDDPTRRLDAPAIKARAPRMVGESQVEQLLGDLTADRPQDRRAIALMAYAGLRVAEAAALEWSSIDQEQRLIYVLGKGDKERTVGLSPVLLDKLLPNKGGNVVTAGGKPVRAATLEGRINRLMDSHGIDHTCHDFRKRFASIAVAKTGDLIGVQRALGHASVVTTQRYVVTSDETIHRIAAAVV